MAPHVNELPAPSSLRDPRGLQQQPMMLARKALALQNLRSNPLRSHPRAAPTPPTSGHLHPTHSEPSTRIPIAAVAGARIPALSVTVQVAM